MKKFIVAAVAAAMTFAAGSASAQEEIRIGVEGAYPPFSSVDPSGNLVGFDIEIANALCDEMKVKCTLVTQDWDGIIPALLAKKYDAIIASMSITEERKQKVDFSEKYYNTPARFLRKKGSGIEITAEGLKGKSVGVQRGTIHDTFLTAEFPDVEIKRYGTQDEAYLDMTAGRVDLLLADSVAMDDGFVKTDAGKDYELFGPSYSEPKYFGEGAGIAVRKSDTELRDRLSAAIMAIRANGVYKSINDKYFDFDIY
ncbi:ABC transporter substrate-binding protein [Kiloniella laminariae]|uniref:ABC transporter substrate-binding protein n=1 Tax=Kiloniella laminariae TaxID=454162 RepID=A0ABT4LIK0_9PROT|nr:ABC transporter substrate-binding protein [Kiloniella laminariae]MCZ4280944.1 ABC transporter substrate-binding protein [Kiloniella laminariae]